MRRETVVPPLGLPLGVPLVLAAVIALGAGAAFPARAQESPMRISPPPSQITPQPRQQPQRPTSQPAQQRRPSAAPAPTAAQPPKPAETPPAPTVPPPYERPLVELAEAIGSLSFLTSLCMPSLEPNAWQKRMDGLIESEGQVQTTREKMMGAYNQGFLAFQTAHRDCSPAAKAARALLVKDAARLAREIERRWGS